MTEEKVKQLIMNFHLMSLNKIITRGESVKIWKRLHDFFIRKGFVVKDDGFYQYKVTQEDENDNS